ncbi:MAG: hypothetical protein ACR2KW_02375 [Rubrobacter sp.]
MTVPNYGNYRSVARYGGAEAPHLPEVGRDSDGNRRRRLERDRWRRESQERRLAARRRRSFVFFVLIPTMLLLGSVYLHNVAADTEERITALQERIDQADSRYEQLGVREAELSNPERIRTLAEDDYGMKDADASQIEEIEDSRDRSTRRAGRKRGSN